MKIAIIGTGHVGGALGGRWARDGHEIIFGRVDPQGEKAQNLLRLVPGNVRVSGTTEAVSTAEVVLLATPWSAISAAAINPTTWAAMECGTYPPISSQRFWTVVGPRCMIKLAAGLTRLS
jgi:predicted dinucleotide-binding enzyme